MTQNVSAFVIYSGVVIFTKCVQKYLLKKCTEKNFQKSYNLNQFDRAFEIKLLNRETLYRNVWVARPKDYFCVSLQSIGYLLAFELTEEVLLAGFI